MKRTVKKYFIPSEENDYKPHILRELSVGILALITVFIFFIGVTQTLVLQKTNFLSAVIPDTLIDLANSDRLQNQLGELSANPILAMAAQEKANDMAEKSYFAHNSPDGKTPWYWFDAVGYKYKSAGENLAINFTDSSEVNVAWMNSEGHRANILNAGFTEIGIATAKGVYNGYETIFVVQMFGKPQQHIAKAPPAKGEEVIPSVVTTKPKTKEVAVASATTSTTTVLGIVAPPPLKVLSESDTYIAVESQPIPENGSQIAVAQNAVESSWFEKALVSPKRTMNTLYLLLGGVILLSLILMISIEIRKQHLKHIAYGVGLLVLILALSYIYRTFIFAHVIVL
jgi:hypothetical protein